MAVFLLAFGAIFLGVWFILHHRNGFWKRQGVPYVPGTLFLGNMKDVSTMKKPIVSVLEDIYNSSAGKDAAVVGMNIFVRPVLMLRDLDLIKAVMVKDFAAFNNR